MQAVTTSDKSQTVTPVSKIVTASQTIKYSLTNVDVPSTRGTYNVTYPLIDNGEGISDDTKFALLTSVGRKTLSDKYGYISWDATTGVDGTINAGGFIHVDNWGEVAVN